MVLQYIIFCLIFRDEDAELDDGEDGGGGVDASYGRGGGDSSDTSSESSADSDSSFGDSDWWINELKSQTISVGL